MPLIEQMGMNHRPHDTRHTCVSMLAVAGVDDKIIKKIVGHKGQSVTETVYTHFEIQELLEAINRIWGTGENRPGFSLFSCVICVSYVCHTHGILTDFSGTKHTKQHKENPWKYWIFKGFTNFNILL